MRISRIEGDEGYSTGAFIVTLDGEIVDFVVADEGHGFVSVPLLNEDGVPLLTEGGSQRLVNRTGTVVIKELP